MTSYHYSRLCGLAIALALLAPLSADPPKKLSPAQFSKLITQSPFTIKPPPGPPAATETPLEREWMLGSIRPNTNGQGYSVTLINKKDRKKRIRFIPGFPSGDFQLLQVKQDTNDNENSRVHVRKGNQTAWLTYDEKLIKLRSSVAASKNPPKNNPTARPSSAAGRPPIPGITNNNRRSGRQRTVPKRTR